MNKHVAVLMGGPSSEREVSLSSGKGVLEALKTCGYQTTAIDVGPDIIDKLQQANPDVAFIALHGKYGEDGCIQGLLEMLQIPYTHSGVMGSALAMNKDIMKSLFKSFGFLCPEGKTVSRQDILDGNLIEPPFVIKPVEEGSSIGIQIIHTKEDINFTEENLFDSEHFIIEKYIPGKDLFAATLDSGPLGVIEIQAKGFYDYENKYTNGVAKHIMPAPIEKEVYDQIMDITYRLHKLLNLSGVSRADFRYDDKGDKKIYLLETNTHPGLTPLSLVPEIARYKNISYEELIKYLVENAKCGK